MLSLATSDVSSHSGADDVPPGYLVQNLRERYIRRAVLEQYVRSRPSEFGENPKFQVCQMYWVFLCGTRWKESPVGLAPIMRPADSCLDWQTLRDHHQIIIQRLLKKARSSVPVDVLYMSPAWRSQSWWTSYRMRSRTSREQAIQAISTKAGRTSVFKTRGSKFSFGSVRCSFLTAQLSIAFPDVASGCSSPCVWRDMKTDKITQMYFSHAIYSNFMLRFRSFCSNGTGYETWGRK